MKASGVRSRAGKPFILAFWSLSCIYCKANLEQLGRLVEEHPRLPLVLVATDTAEESAAIGAMLDKYGLGRRNPGYSPTASWSACISKSTANGAANCRVPISTTPRTRRAP